MEHNNDLFKIPVIGKAKYDSPMKNKSVSGQKFEFTDDSRRVYYDVHISSDDNESLSFEKAGSREKIYFNTVDTRVAIVTCGGLCPGLNDVIRSLVMSLHYNYGVKDVLGIKYGYSGIDPECKNPPVKLFPDDVKDIHTLGGTMLGSSRGNPGTENIVDNLEKMDIDILFCIGGDGTLRGSHDIAEEIKKRKLKKVVLGIPKTIDNDIPYVYRTFGFQSAIQEAKKVLDCAHVEARGAPNGVGLVKLMGRNAGFVAAFASRASGDVNFCLIPEVKFPLHGSNGFLAKLRERLRKRSHAVIAVAEGAGQEIIGDSGALDASGNIRYNDIGRYLRQEIRKAFQNWGETVNVKYFDPSYIIRSVPANSEDSIFCADLARYAVDAAMAGKTDIMIGQWHGNFTHVPLSAVHRKKKKIQIINNKLWTTVLETTGQPFEWGK